MLFSACQPALLFSANKSFYNNAEKLHAEIGKSLFLPPN